MDQGRVIVRGGISNFRAVQACLDADAVSSVRAESPLDEPYLHLTALIARAWMGKSGHGLAPENEAQAA